MKTVAIVPLAPTEGSPPMLACLGEDGNVYVYRPEQFVMHGGKRTIVDKAGWIMLSIPENLTKKEEEGL